MPDDSELPSLLDTLRPDVRPAVYEHYDRIRVLSDPYWDAQLNAWLVTGHDLVKAALVDPHLSSVRYPDLGAVDPSVRPLIAALSRQLFYLDAPDHPRIRNLMSRPFSARSVAALRAQIEVTTDALIDAVIGNSVVDVIEAIAYPLPVSVVCDLLDVPATKREIVKLWSSSIATVLGKAQPSADELRLGVAGMDSMLDYLAELLQAQRERPTSEVFRQFLSSTEVTDEEILANAAALLLVGHETTTNLIGNGLLALLQNPTQLTLLRQRPELIKPAIEELLRYDSSVQNLLRRVTEDTTLGKQALPAGSTVVLVLGAANRDPKTFVDPNVLDLRREGTRHLAFGHGAHACIGAALARLEAEIVILKLLARFPRLSLFDERLDWHPSLTFRGLERLSVDVV